MENNLTKACEIIDNLMMRNMLPAKERLGYKEINAFFCEVGYVTEIDRAKNRRRDTKLEDRTEEASSVL